MKRIDVVNDAIAYYWGRPERMGKNDDGNPVYMSNDKTKSCAIGRLLDQELAASLNQRIGLADNSIYAQMPAKVKELGKGFLMALQDLHDGAHLTRCDKNHVVNMMEPYVDLSQIKYPD